MTATFDRRSLLLGAAAAAASAAPAFAAPTEEQARVIDFDAPANNDWLAVNQFTVSEDQHTRRPDVVLFITGMAVAVIELKNPADENATVWSAFQQLQTYQAQVPALLLSCRSRRATNLRRRIRPPAGNDVS